jgi:hypothetical protein
VPKKKVINLQILIDQIILDYSEKEPSTAYLDCEQEHGEIESSNPIWQLVEDAISYAVEQTIDYLDIYEIEGDCHPINAEEKS